MTNHPLSLKKVFWLLLAQFLVAIDSLFFPSIQIHLPPALDFIDQADIRTIYFSFTSIATMLWAYAADRIWGYKRIIMLGSVFLFLGISLLALPHLIRLPASSNASGALDLAGFVFFVMGQGCIRTNLLVLVANQYPQRTNYQFAIFTLLFPLAFLAYLVSMPIRYSPRSIEESAAVLPALAIISLFACLSSYWGVKNLKKDRLNENLQKAGGSRRRSVLFAGFITLLLLVYLTFSAFGRNDTVKATCFALFLLGWLWYLGTRARRATKSTNLIKVLLLVCLIQFVFSLFSYFTDYIVYFFGQNLAFYERTSLFRTTGAILTILFSLLFGFLIWPKLTNGFSYLTPLFCGLVLLSLVFLVAALSPVPSTLTSYAIGLTTILAIFSSLATVLINPLTNAVMYKETFALFPSSGIALVYLTGRLAIILMNRLEDLSTFQHRRPAGYWELYFNDFQELYMGCIFLLSLFCIAFFFAMPRLNLLTTKPDEPTTVAK